MKKDFERIIVIGASSGGFEAFKIIIKQLPADFSTPIFIVWHMSPHVHGILPEVLNRENKIYTAHAYNNEEIQPNRIYIAPADHHMLIYNGKIRITHGPKENRFRPAVDPLFRSAAYAYGNRAIGVILSGSLNDGTAGLWTIKHYGGVAIVQDPLDAEVSSMPENARREVNIDYCISLNKMASLLIKITQEPKNVSMKDQQTKYKINTAAEANALENGSYNFGQSMPFTCPECCGVLNRLQNDNIVRYRCSMGHDYSADSLIMALTEKIEYALYNALRGMDESIMLLNHLGDYFAEANEPKFAAVYFKKAKETDKRSQLIRRAALEHEQLLKKSLKKNLT